MSRRLPEDEPDRQHRPFCNKSPNGLPVLKGPRKRSVERHRVPITWHHWRSRLGQERGCGGDTSPVIPPRCLTPSPSSLPLAIAHRYGRPKLQCKDKQKMLILSFCFYKGPPLDNERILKGYFDDRWFLPQESDFGDSTVEWPEQEGCGQTRKAGNAGAVPAGWLTSSPCKKCTFIPISFLSWGYIELMRKTCGKDSQLLDNGMRR